MQRQKRKNNFIRFVLCAFAFAIFGIIFPLQAFAAANLSLSPASASHYIGDSFSVVLKVNTGGAAINAAQSSLTFDNARLSISSISTSSSIFTLWPESPTFSNVAGTISFSGGLPSPGYTETSGTIFTINFTAVAQGSAVVSFNAGSQVLANDGSGTNIFGTASGGTYTITPAPLTISCSSAPNPAAINQSVTFSSSVSGGIAPYTYSWTGDCTGSSSTCSDSFGSAGTKTVTLEVTSSDSQTETANCTVAVSFPALSVACSASAESVETNISETYTATVSGGNGSYTYSWTGDCTGSASTCLKSYSTKGLKNISISVTSGDGQTSSDSCVVYISLPCATCGTCVTSGGGGGGGRCAICQCPVLQCPIPSNCPVPAKCPLPNSSYSQSSCSNPLQCATCECPAPTPCPDPKIAAVKMMRQWILQFALWTSLLFLVIILLIIYFLKRKNPPSGGRGKKQYPEINNIA